MTFRVGLVWITVVACVLLAPAIAAASRVSVSNAVPVAHAATQTQTATFLFNDKTQYFTVPVRVTQLQLLATGGGGGVGEYNPFEVEAPRGGAGAQVTETVRVTPGDILVVEVGGGGASGDYATSLGGAGGLSSGAALNGGSGGNSTTANPNGGAGGGGGGGTELVNATTGSLLLVAGGGGGGGGTGFDLDMVQGFNQAGAGGSAAPPAQPGGVGGAILGTPLTAGGAAADLAGGSATNGSDGTTDNNGSYGGAGGGGGAGYNPSTAGQNAGSGGQAGFAPGFGMGGGGGGGGASYASAAGAQFSAAPAPAASDLNGLDGGVTVSWTPPVTLGVDTSSLRAATSGLRYAQALSASGGTGPYTWSLASGKLPAGLSLSPASGAISGVPRAPGTSTFAVRVTDSAATPHKATQTLTIHVNPGPMPGTYVLSGNTVRAFALGASGNVVPEATISGPVTGLALPDGLVFDSSGYLYVSNAQTDTITVYAPASSGDVAPIGTIAGPATGLTYPAGLAIDAGGNLYVADRTANQITVYGVHAGGSGAPTLGDLAPVRTITGPDTGLSSPAALTFDPAGHLWIAESGNSTLGEYAASAGGDSAPLASISGSQTGLNFPQALTIDSSGSLIAASTFGGTIATYPSTGPSGNVPSSSEISGPATGFDFPDGVDVDVGNRLYVANEFGGPAQTGSLNVFAAGASGDISPVAVIAGTNTGLSHPGAVAVTPPMKALSTTLPAAALDRRYSARAFEVLGKPPLRWRLIRGHLPPGLRLAPDGAIGGTPRRLGTSRFTVEVTDSSMSHQKARAAITLMVIDPPVITALSPAHGSRRGNTSVTISGIGFTPGAGRTVFTFGSTPARNVRCRTARRCTAVTLGHAPGTVTVTAIVDSINSRHTPRDRFRYTRLSRRS